MSFSPRLSLAAALAALFPAFASAQIEYGGEPPSTYYDLEAEVPTVTMRPVDVAALLEEDAARQGKGPFRFGENLEVDLGFEHGVWEAVPSGRVWRLRVASAGAYSISFIFSRYELSPGAELYVYNDDRSVTYGQYNDQNNNPDGQMAMQPLPGAAVTLEYFEPAWIEREGLLRIGTVVHDYRDVFAIYDASAESGADGACEIDVACPEGAPWGNQIRATTRLIIGGTLCSGSLVNNTAFDGAQLYISANHCGSLTNAVFQFKYQRPACGSGAAPSSFTVQGSTQLAASSSFDYRLVRINPAIPASYEPFFAGWNRSTSTIPPKTVTVHHPGGDPKKISFDNNAPVKAGSQWRILQWDLGVTEGGSSGCPLYDNNGRFIGQLCCGAAFCGFPFDDFYGRMDSQWSQIAAHLDPLGTGQTAIDGFDPFATAPVITGIAPGSTAVFGSGLITLTGTGFSGATAVHVGTTTLTAGGFTIASDTSITFNAPVPTSLGTVQVTVEKPAGTSNPVNLTYVETSPPALSVTGVALTGLAVNWAFGAGVNDLWFLFVSVNDGSTVPFMGYNLLANGFFLTSGTLSGVGTGSLGAIVPPGLAGSSVYSQVILLDGAGFFFDGATNVGVTTILL